MKRLGKIHKEEGLEKILVEYGKRYRKLKYIADALSISYQLLLYWLKKIGIDKEDFYRKKVCKSNCLVIKIEGGYRYKFEGLVRSKCRCRIGFDVLVVKIKENELLDLCNEKNLVLRKKEDDRFIIALRSQ